MLYFRTIFILVALSVAACNQESTAANANPEADTYKLIKESWAIGDALKGDIWPDWQNVGPEILLMENDREFLIGPRPLPSGFELIGPAGREDWTIMSRPAVFNRNMLATFPGFGPPATIIVGTPAATNRTPEAWVITLLHENFHQLQYGQPDYYPGTAALGLAEDENDGMWMLNYPFPYDDDAVNAAFESMTASILAALAAPDHEVMEGACKYYQAKQAMRRTVSEKDFRYFEFQLWQEGMAEYTAYRVAEAAAEQFGAQYAVLARKMHADAEAVIAEHGVLKNLQRVAFYPLGHLEGALLDRANPGWQAGYLDEPFQTDSLFPCAS